MNNVVIILLLLLMFPLFRDLKMLHPISMYLKYLKLKCLIMALTTLDSSYCHSNNKTKNSQLVYVPSSY